MFLNEIFPNYLFSALNVYMISLNCFIMLSELSKSGILAKLLKEFMRKSDSSPTTSFFLPNGDSWKTQFGSKVTNEDSEHNV